MHLFIGDQCLDKISGQPQTIELPGHTNGTVACHFHDLEVLFTGDALVTRDDLIGHTGPCLVARGFTHSSAAALASLDRLAKLPMALVLPGHGDPFTGGPQAAVTQAREAGQR